MQLQSRQAGILKRANYYKSAPYAIVLVTLLAVSNINLKKDYANGSMEADGKGYYAYLPAIFIYHDLSFGFYNTIERVTYYNPDLNYEYLRSFKNKTINKYYSGTAFCMMPFFGMGHLNTLISGTAADGYSYYYMLWIHIGALLYLLVGLIAMRKILRTYRIAEKWIAFTLACMTFGTSLFYYTLTEYSMSHLYSFAVINFFLLCVRKYSLKHDKRLLLYAGFLLGIIVLIRPVNIVIIFSIPFISGGFRQIKDCFTSMLKHKVLLFLGFIAFLAVGSIQLIIYKIQTGTFFVYSYPGEGFDFLKPHFLDMLISYRKGLLVYTPMILLSLLGFVYLWRQSRFAATSLAIFLLLLTYILSSWHMWFYGGSFSQRVFIDFYAFFAILLATAFYNLPKGWIRNAYFSVAIVLTLFCQVQTYQYRHMIIHWSDMNKEKYWEVFLKIR